VPSVSEQVSVSAERPRGEAAAINEQRTAANIVQVVTSEVITSCPTPISPTPSDGCRVFPLNVTKARANTSRFAAPIRASAT
jgi:hypothetical protein